MWEAWLPHIVAKFCNTTFIVALSLPHSWHVMKGYGSCHDFKASSLGIFNCHYNKSSFGYLLYRKWIVLMYGLTIISKLPDWFCKQKCCMLLVNSDACCQFRRPNFNDRFSDCNPLALSCLNTLLEIIFAIWLLSSVLLWTFSSESKLGHFSYTSSCMNIKKYYAMCFNTGTIFFDPKLFLMQGLCGAALT